MLCDWGSHPDAGGLDLMAEGLHVAGSALGGRASGAPSGPATFRAFVEQRNPDLLRYEHIPRLVDVCERVVVGQLLRVLVILPPRYFKSELFSRLLPAHYLQRHPERHAGLASYGAALAWELSEEARGHFVASGGELRPETKAKRRWRTRAGGAMWADGAGGALLGRGFHLGVVDDPLDPVKSESPTYQRRFETWWPGKFLSRQEPGAAIVVVMQRLGVLDPIDFLLRREVGEDTDEAPEGWHVVVCDEVRSDAPLGRWDGPRGLPPTCTVEEDPRPLGAVLAPSRFDRAAVDRMQRSAGTYVTAAQRQARPAVPKGTVWREEWFGVYDELPADAFDGGRDWDTALTKDEHNSASAVVRSFRGPDRLDEAGKVIRDSFPIYVDEADWEWKEFPELVAWMRLLRGPHHIEAKASGKSAAQTLRSHGVTVSEVKVEGDKLKRASGVQPIVAEGRVRVRKNLLRRLLHGERQGLLRVRAETLVAGGPDLDLNDAFVQAIHRHTGGAAGGPRFRSLA
jgi:hypothetical protein